MNRGRSLERVVRACSFAPATLFLARVALEVTRRPVAGTLVVAVGLGAAAAGFALGLWLVRRSPPHWSAWLPLAYVVWPRRDLVAATAIGVLALTTWLLSRDPQPRARSAGLLADGLLFLVSAGVFLATAAPDVLPADAGEFQLAAARFGVAHPPGFPLYTALGGLFVRLWPFGTPAYRLNALSSLMAAGALVFTAAATRTWARRLGAHKTMALAAGVGAALALGTATTFWGQAGIANVRTPSTLCVALTLYGLARYSLPGSRRQADRTLLLTGAGLGLGLGHHPSLVFVALVYVGYVLASEPKLIAQPRRWWRLAVAVPVGVLPYAYLPIRGAMDAPLAPPRLETLQGFLDHALARGFAGDMFAYVNAADLPHRMSLIPTLFRFQFNAALIWIGLLGLALLVGIDWRLAALLVGSLAVHTFVAITYRAPQTVEYLMPAVYPVIGIAVGLFPTILGKWCHASGLPARAALVPFAAAGVGVAGALNGWVHHQGFVERSLDRTARDTVAALLTQAPRDALLLSDWHWVTPLWYVQQVEGVRPDVETRYVYNVAGEEYRETWRTRIEQAPPDRPLLTTHFYQFDGYTTEPFASGFAFHRRPLSEPMSEMDGVGCVFGGSVRILGFHLRPEVMCVGQPIEVTLAWQAVTELSVGPSLSVRLEDGVSGRVAQADRRLSTAVEPAEVRFERLTVPVYPFLASGRYTLTLSAYITSEDGFEDLATEAGVSSVALASLHLSPARAKTYAQHRQASPFADGPELVGVSYDRSVDGILRTYLQWTGPIPSGMSATVAVGGNASATKPLPAVPGGAYQTIALDVPDPVSGKLSLLLRGGGVPGRAAASWGWSSEVVRLPIPRPRAAWIPLGTDLAVEGATARPAPPGDEMIIEAHLVGLRSLTTDYAVSIRLIDMNGRWLARQDWQPALGAIPTLKWIGGSRIVDRHLLEVPHDFGGGIVRAELVAYERFREAPLPPVDGRFGQAPLGSWVLKDAVEGSK